MLNFRSLFINNGKEKIIIPSFKVEDIEFVEKDNEDCYILVHLLDKTIQRLDFGYYNNWYFDRIIVKGHVGTWYTIETQITDGILYLLLEHEAYGDETACVIIDIDGNLILEDVWNGFDDLDEYLDDVKQNNFFHDIQQVITLLSQVSDILSNENLINFINETTDNYWNTPQNINEYIETLRQLIDNGN